MPLDKIKLPKGPEYVIMCYNLYGYRTEPGPKADKEFIDKLIEKTNLLPGEISFALATGGFDFGDNGTIVALTEREALELARMHDKSPIMDRKSNALFFNYVDNQKIEHKVWYANGRTIEYWIDVIKQSGNNNISLWKIGGNINLENII